ncbi:SPOR domain-containing protein [Flavobacterium sp.]|uniref:SPOR domain-containing protein n=1 Tax=Flavobacterium sp. TaxID=239 RepID=UPI002620CF9F|nr:SPOR domain-containing protein [Flavobacterium sp.]
MLTNTGTASFILYGFFMLISIIAMILAFIYMKKDIISSEKLDKMIELFKYTIVSTCIATVTLVVSNLFKERDQDIKELEYFDKYVTDIKKADGVYERWQLSKYLSIVSPSGELRKSWEQYYSIVDKEYTEYLNLKNVQLKNNTILSPNEKQLFNIEKVEEKINQLEKPLQTSYKLDNEEWIIITGADKKLEDAENELKKVLAFNPNSRIIKKGTFYRTIIFGFNDKSEASKVLTQARQKLNKTAYIVKNNNNL